MARTCVEFTVAEDGTLTVHVQGVAGPACDDLLRRIADLTGRPSSERKTPEYDQRAAVAPRQQIGGGR